MKLLVLKKMPPPFDEGDFECQTEEGRTMFVDLLRDGHLGDIDPASLVGWEVECDYTHPYISIAEGVRLVPIAEKANA